MLKLLIALFLWMPILNITHADELSEIEKAHELIQGKWKCKQIVESEIFPGEVNTIWTILPNEMVDDGTFHFSLTIDKVMGSANITGLSVDRYEFVSPNIIVLTPQSTDEKLTDFSKNSTGRYIRDVFFVDYLKIKEGSIAQSEKVFSKILLLNNEVLMTVDFEPSAPDNIDNLRQCTRTHKKE